MRFAALRCYRCRILSGAIGLAVSGAAGLAQSTPVKPPAGYDATKDCDSADTELRIKGCGELIKAGKARGASLAELYARRGHAYYQKRQLDAALADYTNAIQLEPKEARHLVMRGAVHGLAGEPYPALADLDQAVKLDPSLREALINRGALYFAQGQNDRAIADFDRALELDPGDARAYVRRGLVREALGEFDAALADFDRTLVDLRNVGTYRVRGALLANMGHLHRALADYDEAIALVANSPLLYRERAAVHAVSGDFKKALEDIDRARALPADGAVADTLRIRAMVLEKLGRTDEALADLGAALKASERDAGALAERARLLSMLGRQEAALADAQKAVQSNPFLAAAYLSRAAVLARTGKKDQAVADLDRALAYAADKASVHAGRASTFSLLGDLRSARVELESALRADPRNGDALLQRAVLLAGLDRQERAMADIDRAVAVMPSPEALGMRASLHWKAGRIVAALDDFQAALLRAPAYPPAVRSLERIVTELTGRIEHDPKAAGAIGARGLALLALGRTEAAVADLEKAVSLDAGNARYHDALEQAKKALGRQ